MPLRYAEPAPEAYRQPLTIRHLLDANELSAAGQTIGYRDHLRLTYADLRARIGRLASALAGLGVEQGTTVAMLDWDSHRYLESYFAVPMMGAVLQTVNIRLSPAQVLYTLRHARAEILVVHRDFWPLVEPLRAELPDVRAIVTIGELGAEGGDDRPDWSAGEYEALLADADPVFAFADFDEDALATTFYTTGTTGLPKAVCFSHRQLVLHTLATAATFAAREEVNLRDDDVYMPLTPMFHVHAWGLPYVATMLGLKQIYPGRYDPALIVGLFAQEGVTFSHCVPTVMQMVLGAAGAAGVRLDGWKMLIGGSALTRDATDQARAAGLAVAAGYGMSETGPIVAVSKPGRDPGAAIRSGTIVPLVSARIVDEAMTPLPADDTSKGELVLRAPWLTPCYPGDSAASEALWRGGWLHTQDIATIDAEGSLQIRDRLKDVIKTGGEWLCSLTLEDAIVRHPDIAEVAVVGVADAKWGERPVAVIVPATGAAPDLSVVNGTLAPLVASGVLSRYALLDRAVLVAALPRTSVGKIDKKAIREQVAGG